MPVYRCFFDIDNMLKTFKYSLSESRRWRRPGSTLLQLYCNEQLVAGTETDPRRRDPAHTASTGEAHAHDDGASDQVARSGPVAFGWGPARRRATRSARREGRCSFPVPVLRSRRGQGAQALPPLGPFDQDGVRGLSLPVARDKAAEFSRIYRSGITDLHAHCAQRRVLQEQATRETEEKARTAVESAQRPL